MHALYLLRWLWCMVLHFRWNCHHCWHNVPCHTDVICFDPLPPPVPPRLPPQRLATLGALLHGSRHATGAGSGEREGDEGGLMGSA